MGPGGNSPVVIRPGESPVAGTHQAAPAAPPTPTIPHTDIHLPRKSTAVAMLAAAVVLVVSSAFIGSRLFGRNTTQVIENGEGIDAATLSIDSTAKAVGIAAESPSGLQIGATVQPEALGVTNVRLGLAGDDRLPSLVLEGGDSDVWSLMNSSGALQLLHGGELRAQLDDQALTLHGSMNVADNATLGDGADDTLTLNGTAVAIPNNLNVGSAALFIDAANKSVGIGTTDNGGFRLRVAGSVRADGDLRASSVRSDGAISGGSLAVTGEVRSSSLRVDGGAAIASDLQVDGYIRAGSGNPAWQLRRYTGSLDGSGAAQITHSISNLPARILLVTAFYKGNSGEAVPMTVEYTNSHIRISGGIAGRAYRVSITYSQDTPAW